MVIEANIDIKYVTNILSTAIASLRLHINEHVTFILETSVVTRNNVHLEEPE